MTSIFSTTSEKAALGNINSQVCARPFLSPELDSMGLEEGSGYA